MQGFGYTLKKYRIALAIILVCCIVAHYWPFLLIFILGVNFLLVSFQAFSQLWWAYRPYKKLKYAPVNEPPFVSIHIPICNEPAEMVIATIKSCLNLDYINYEIIVLDNNTSDEQVWKPVESFCREYSRVKFEHIDKLKGYKAGALDKCMSLSSPRAKYFFVVDADYLLKANSLKKAVGFAEAEKAAMVQFPQQYYNGMQIPGLEEEYRHYFKVFANGSNQGCSTLPTGTLSFYCKKALLKVGGWQSQSITEDAEMGLKFRQHTFKTVFSPVVLGEGLMPGSIIDIWKQRERWAYGNAQCLIKLLSLKAPFRSKLSMIIQLSAWINFTGLPLLVLMSIMIASFSQGYGFEILYLMIVSNLGVFYLGKFMLMAISGDFEPRAYWRSFLTHITFHKVHAFGWWEAVLGSEKPFTRTNKFKKSEVRPFLPVDIWLMYFLASLFFFDQQHLPFAAFFLMLSAMHLTGVTLLEYQINTKPSEAINFKTIKT